MKAILLLIMCGWLITPVQAGTPHPINWIKHHKRFLVMESAAIAGASIDAWGLHHCRRGGVEPCTAHYGEAWATFGISAGLTTVLAPGLAEMCWKNDESRACGAWSYVPSATQAAWGLHEYRIKPKKDTN